MTPVRFSSLKLIAKSPAHYLANVNRDSSAKFKGSAVHSALLGGQRITFYPKLTDAGKAAPRNGKDWESFKADNADALILSREEHAAAAGMVASVRACPEAMRVLEGVREETILWDYLGRPCRATPDVRTADYVTELKTCRTSDPRHFVWDALRFGYHAQLAWYLEAVAKSKLGTPEAAFVVAVESSAPYVVTVLRLTDRALEQGRRMFRLWFERLRACEESNEWPGYAQSVVAFDVPDEDRELEFGDAEEEAAA